MVDENGRTTEGAGGRPYKIKDAEGPGAPPWQFDLMPNVAGHESVGQEARFLNLAIGRIGNFVGHPLDGTFVRDIEIAAEREKCVAGLRDLAEDFCAGDEITNLVENVVRVISRYEGAEAVIKARHANIVVVKPDSKQLAERIEFRTEGFPTSPDQEQLISDVTSAQTVVHMVMDNRRRAGQDLDTVASRRSECISALADIARTGLGDARRVRLAAVMLDTFKANFVSQEGQFVKNRYVSELLFWCSLIGAGCALAYIGVRWIIPPGWPWAGVVTTNRSFFALAAAACAGTWLSFSVRKPSLTFIDLANPENDQLKPVMRVLLVVGLATVLGTFVALDIVDIRLGPMRLRDAFLGSGLYAIAIGAACGLSELLLTKIVSRRASDFLGRLGGHDAAPLTAEVSARHAPLFSNGTAPPTRAATASK